MVSPDVQRKLLWVPVSKLRGSSVLPKRDSYDEKILESMKRDGVQQPLIVRQCPDDPNLYEIIDGHMRRQALKQDDKALVDVRVDAKDSEVFQISHMTFNRGPLSTYERARFYSTWTEAEKRESDKTGAQARVADSAGISEGLVSQYLMISQMFQELEKLIGSTAPETVNALKNLGVNRLYELSRLTGTSVFAKTAEQLAENPRMPIRKLKQLVADLSLDKQMLQDVLRKKG